MHFSRELQSLDPNMPSEESDYTILPVGDFKEEGSHYNLHGNSMVWPCLELNLELNKTLDMK